MNALGYGYLECSTINPLGYDIGQFCIINGLLDVFEGALVLSSASEAQDARQRITHILLKHSDHQGGSLFYTHDSQVL